MPVLICYFSIVLRVEGNGIDDDVWYFFNRNILVFCDYCFVDIAAY